MKLAWLGAGDLNFAIAGTQGANLAWIILTLTTAHGSTEHLIFDGGNAAAALARNRLICSYIGKVASLNLNWTLLQSEACDDGPGEGGGQCTDDCIFMQTCGDGRVVGTEVCDNGANNSNTVPGACRTNCTPARCGDGALDAGEGCDDGNTVTEGEGFCTGDCARIQACGDGFLDGLESCDDGYEDACGDCDATCTGPGTGAVCGDTFTCPQLEACDDGNHLNEGDGACVADCSAVQTCGDGDLQGTELCDDGAANATGEGKCLPGCMSAQICGDGDAEGSEGCDDGNRVSEGGGSCAGDCSRIQTCGDGFETGTETCDDGGDNDSGEGFCVDGCMDVQTCGDGDTNGSEGCDDGNEISDGDGFCTADCARIQDCGDTFIDGAEACDDGNTVSEGEGQCTGDCSGFQACGDGQVEGSEGCDYVGVCDGPVVYRSTNVWNASYPDEIHNIAMNGSGQGNNSNGYNADAIGQLTDGARGVDSILTDLGHGVAYEWVAWAFSSPVLTFRLPRAKWLDRVTVGVARWTSAQVPQPIRIDLAFSTDGTTFTGSQEFSVANGTLAVVPDVTRRDLVLELDAVYATHVRVTVFSGGEWLFLDEVAFVGSCEGEGGCLDDCSGIQTCGDGATEGTEVCDDGNASDGDGDCVADCTASEVCGDGVVTGAETCDDGDTDACGACNADCSGAGTGSTCGDGFTCPQTEACDDGPGQGESLCLDDCSGIQHCGDDTREGSESCDDGFTDPCGSCNADCSAAGAGATCGDGFTCPESEYCDDGAGEGDGQCVDDCSAVQECGDGFVHGTEACDDGDGNDDEEPDACRTDCTPARCGDGVEGDHTLTDTLTIEWLGDGCATPVADLVVTVNGVEVFRRDLEPTPSCSCTSLYGPQTAVVDSAAFRAALVDGNNQVRTRVLPAGANGFLAWVVLTFSGPGGETELVPFANGNTAGALARDGDICDFLPLSQFVNVLTNVPLAVTEACDDGNTVSEGEGECTADCASLQTCGDGVVTGTESCDDGNTDACGACNADCTGAGAGSTCGDGFICPVVEACDDGPGGTCFDDCSAENQCGDGVVFNGEGCDDHNTADCDACRGDCSRVDDVCGDGFTECGEGCDDGDTDSCATPACDATCDAPFVNTCGDEIVCGAEECDEGDDNDDEAAYACRTDCNEAGCGDGVVDTESVTAITLEWFEFVCSTGSGTIRLVVNGVELVNTAIDPTNSCNPFCSDDPSSVRKVTLTSPAALANLHQGNNILRVYTSGFAVMEWALASVTVTTGGVEQRIDLVHYDGNNQAGALARGSNPCSFTYDIDGIDFSRNLALSLRDSEGCDDGNTVSEGEGSCAGDCQVQECGDGVTNGTETCDDGGSNGTGDGLCLEGCADVQECGDGDVEGSEDCDDGNTDSEGVGFCAGDCTGIQECGDGETNGTEACDAELGCLNECTLLQVCGNGDVEGTEECDDGDDNSATAPFACRTDCRFAHCGDGVRDDQPIVSARLDWSAVSCGAVSDTIVVTVNGVPIISRLADSARGCNLCQPALGAQSYTVTDPPVSLAAFRLGDNAVRLHLENPGAENAVLGWAQLTVSTATDSQVIALWDSGDADRALAHDPELCSYPDLPPTGFFDQTLTASLPFHSENCDDGAVQGHGQCINDCSGLESCGNSVREGSEVCDDGALTGEGKCLSSCAALQRCGDGSSNGTEGCDDGNTVSEGPGACPGDCTRIQTCGDGFKTGSEFCDDGDTMSCGSAGCNAACTGPFVNLCGDGIACGTEQCDDGSTNSDLEPDTCRLDCTVPSCGDGVTDPSFAETCDDAGESADCDDDCTGPICGDANPNEDAGEACDDGDGNSCFDDCSAENACGDGVVFDDEDCDDHNTVSEGEGSCAGDCSGIQDCGDGTRNGTEGCDDGNTVSEGQGSCVADCSAVQSCGNGVTNGTEACDDGNTVSEGQGSCLANCTGVQTCGDGDVEGTEGCDDGNTVSEGEGSCLASCSGLQTCGDSDVEGTEACDDPSQCDPAEYASLVVPGGLGSYWDEVHNIAINGAGQGTNTNGFAQYAIGQLTDGVKGVNNLLANLGNGVAYEWVGYRNTNVTLTYRFPVRRSFTSVSIGVGENIGAGVPQPAGVDVFTSDDGTTFTLAAQFSTGAGTFPDFPNLTRTDVVLSLAGLSGKYIRLVILRVGEWVFLDEVVLAGTCQGEGLCTVDCTAIQQCGNSVREGTEVCDDGALAGDGACLADCSAVQTCGDGVRAGTEVCDDGPGGTCHDDCTAVNTCGDGRPFGAEVCDDGPGGSCFDNCSAENQCGDGIAFDGEACDDGFTDACGSCDPTCTGAGTGADCGDGFPCPELEACDDGNEVSEGEGFCAGDCSGVQDCGDAFENGTELCDDGPGEGDGECLDDCSGIQDCGDAAVEGSEACEPFALTVTALSNPATAGTAQWMTSVGDLVYVAERASGFQIFDLKNPAAPVLKGGFDTAGDAWDVAVKGTIAYVATASGGTLVMDVSNLAAPEHLMSLLTGGLARGLAVQGNILAVADDVGGVKLHDITNPASPVFLGSQFRSGSGFDVDVAFNGTLVYVTERLTGLRVLNIANPAAPVWVGSPINVGGSESALAVAGGYLYVGRAGGVSIFSLASPTAPALVASVTSSPGQAEDVFVHGGFLYAAYGASGLLVADVHNPAAPVVLGLFDTPGTATGAIAIGDLVAIGDAASGLKVVRVNRDGWCKTDCSLLYQDCGNGVVEDSERCDGAGDSAGCDGDCSPVACGDAYANSVTEGCDDANTNNNDACLGTCADATCGDGILWNQGGGTETCDDGPGGTCHDDCSAVNTCGDGIPFGSEVCDDGPGGLCHADCMSYCGDGTTDGGYGEGCDDGNNVSEGQGSCLADCSRLQICGDDNTDGTETCDDGAPQGEGLCLNDCSGFQECGDGVVAGSEGCDDHNTASEGDGSCAGDCSRIQDCGDGFTTGTEPCDQASYAVPLGTGADGALTTGRGVAVQGTRAYLANETDGLRIYDVSNPSAPSLLGTWDSPDWAASVAVAGSLAFLADGSSGLHIVDVSVPATPSLVATFNTPGNAMGVALAGTLVFVADGDAGLRVLDASAPAAPVSIGSLDTDFFARTVVLDGATAYVTEGGDEGGLLIVDVSDPTAPVALGWFSMGEELVLDVAVSGDYAYITAWTAGLRVIDISDPADPVEVAVVATAPHFASEIEIAGTRAYVAATSGGLRVYDISAPLAPVLLGTSAINPAFHAVALAGGTAYVGDYYGLRSFDIRESCTRACAPPSCGDGAVSVGEGCETSTPGYPCDTDTCELIACGNGVVDAGEDCDDGEGNAFAPDACRPDCSAPVCGDAVIDSGEDCDDGLGEGEGLCLDDCSDFQACGDGNVEGSEECEDPNPCGPRQYITSYGPGALGGYDVYPDDGHNVAVNGAGQEFNTAGFGTYAVGSLTDGFRNPENWTAASLTPWVGFRCSGGAPCGATLRNAVPTFRFAGVRTLGSVSIGIGKWVSAGAPQPTGVDVYVSDDGVDFELGPQFSVGAGTFPTWTDLTREDVVLDLSGLSGRYLRLDIATAGEWVFLDEIEFTGECLGEGLCTPDCMLQSCGDGDVEGSEGCDDGNEVSEGEGGCSANCSGVQTCGDTFVDGTETCDDGNAISDGDGFCVADCSAIEDCGDGDIEGTEDCDDSGESAECDANCSEAFCGDGDVNATLDEACDDGNATSDGDGSCVADCSAIEECGDGVTNGTEGCDDNNEVTEGNGFCAGDCSGVQVCGNGVANGSEVCDDFPRSYAVAGAHASFTTNGIALGGTVAYAAATSFGLRILDVSDPFAPTQFALYDTPGSSDDVVVLGDVAFVADTYGGLEIVDVSDPGAPSFIANRPGYVRAIFGVGPLLYLATASGLEILDVSVPATPTLLGSEPTGNPIAGLVVVGGVAYAAAYGTLFTIDVSDPADPIVLAYALTTSAVGVDVVDGVAYVADSAAGLTLVDVSDPEDPVVLSSLGLGDSALGVDVEGSLAYVATGWGGLKVVDVSNPLAPRLVGSRAMTYAINVTVREGLAYVGDLSGVVIVDVSNDGLCAGDCLDYQDCGDGIVQPYEPCDDGDDGNQSNDCLDGCYAPTCGDGLVWDEGTGDEFCDDGVYNGAGSGWCRIDCSGIEP